MNTSPSEQIVRRNRFDAMKKLFGRARRLADSGTHGFVLVILMVCGLQFLLSALFALPWGGLVSANCRWDCAWYEQIMRSGYSALPHFDPDQAGKADWAFFPLYPLFARQLALLLPFGFLTTGLLLNLALWPLLIFLCHRELELRGITINRLTFALFFALFPLNIWYTAQYSEAIYGVALMAAIIALRENRVPLAAVCVFLLSLSRPTGFILTLCLAGWRMTASQDPTASSRKRLSDGLLLIAAGGAALSLFTLYLYGLTGDGFAFAHVQIAWKRHLRFFPLVILYGLLTPALLGFTLSAVLAIVVIVRMWKQSWRLPAILVGTTALLALSSGVVSIERYIFANPLTIQFLACTSLAKPVSTYRKLFLDLVILRIIAINLWYAPTFVLM
ncbi:hypothetical protein AA0472_0545 [Acetobacter estunensis NRIC 0472]|uniref:DUF2029 domain-containing protein n=1 Tax=Acetobacter estunensis TaxID=104097 RepID=A0A967EJG6_9PROT|nr:hypothetical protein [Acetobacter estunensis]NHO55059.1 hypothetical protein [Acetobacter estunensis]GBQ21734.1 hypothetical protein AA0472_0545 [Acetobacter estunensis NRIC 0472]